jgi:hypothetical protein
MKSTTVKLEKSKLSLPFLTLGYMLVLAGLYFLFALQWPAVLIIPGLLISSVYSQRYLNFTNLKLTDETKLFGAVLWKTESDIAVPDYIVLRPVNMTGRQSVLTISRTESLSLYRINFVYPQNKVRIIYTGNYKSAEEIGRLSSEYFQVPFRNRAQA